MDAQRKDFEVSMGKIYNLQYLMKFIAFMN